MIGQPRNRLLALVVMAALAGCSQDDNDADQDRDARRDQSQSETADADAPIDINAGAYTEEIRSSFTNACTERGGTDAYCGCAIDKIAETLPIKEFVAYEQAVLEGTSTAPPTQVTDAMKQCAR